MLKPLILMSAMTLVGSPDAHAIENLKRYIPAAEKVGEGRLTYLFWDVYDATLFAPMGEYNQDKPFALRLSYLREIEGKTIADRSAQEMREQGITDEVKLATWHAQMRKIFPDVREGINLYGVKTEDGRVIFYKNEEKVGEVNDPQFTEAFFKIWLNEDTKVPSLRKKLLGAS